MSSLSQISELIKITFRTTLEEREIIKTIPQNKVEEWAERKDFWRIYRTIIKATKIYINSETSHNTSFSKDFDNKLWDIIVSIKEEKISIEEGIKNIYKILPKT